MRRVCIFVAFATLVFSGCEFTEEEITGLPGDPKAVAVGDFDGNGMPDAVAGFDLSVSGVALAMQDDYGFWSHRPVANLLFGGSDLLAVTDADDDGSPDIVAGGTDSGIFSLLLNNGDATFDSVPVLLPAGAQLRKIAVGESAGGRRLVVARYLDLSAVTRYATFEATGGMLVNAQTAWTPSTAIDSDALLRVADFNRDGHLDLAAGNDNGNIEVFSGSSSSFGDFSTTAGLTLAGPGAGGVTAFAIGDAGTPPELQNWSVDGFPDVLVGYSSSPIVHGMRGQSGGGYASAVALGDSTNFGAAPLYTVNIEITGAHGAWGTNLADASTYGGAVGFIGNRFGGSGYFQAASCGGPAQALIDTQGEFEGFDVPGIVVACGSGNQLEYVAMQRGRLKVTQSPNDYGEQLVGSQSAAQTLTVDAVDAHFSDATLESEVNVSEWRLEGTDAEDFSVTASTGNCPLFVEMDMPPNVYHHNNCSAQVRFTPQSPGAKSARLVIVNDGIKAPDAPYQSVELEGFATSKLLTAQESLDLGRVAADRVTAVPVKNDGNRDVNLSGVSINPAVPGWSVSMGDCGATLAPGATCEVSVTFGGGLPRESAASLEIAGDQQDAPTTVALSAQKVSGAVTGDDLDYGAVEVDDSSSLVATLTNDDEDAVAFDQLLIEGADADRFSVTYEDCTEAPVAAGGTCMAIVAVSPTERGSLGATLRASNDSAGGDAQLTLTASGIQGVLAATEDELAFGNVAPGASTDRSITLSNEGDADLVLGEITVGSPFSITGDCSGVVLAASESCELELKFAPQSPGEFSGEVTIPHDGESGTRTVAVKGESPAPPPVVQIGEPRILVGSPQVARSGRSVRVDLAVFGQGGPLTDVAVSIRLPKGMSWRPMSSARDARQRPRRVVLLQLGDLPEGGSRDVAVRIFSKSDLRGRKTSLRATLSSAQGAATDSFVVGPR